jgi:hypothetical protein
LSRSLALVIAASMVSSVGCDSCSEPHRSNDSAASGPRCTAEVTAGSGTHRASRPLAEGQSKKALRKELFAEACTSLCEADGKAGEELPTCRARCEVDITAEKVGARFSCE